MLGLAKDKVNEVVSMIRVEDGFEYENLDAIDELLIEALSHLQQTLDNLGDEE